MYVVETVHCTVSTIFLPLLYDFAIPLLEAFVQLVNGKSLVGKYLCGDFASSAAAAIDGYRLFLVEFVNPVVEIFAVDVHVDGLGQVPGIELGRGANIHHLRFLLMDDFGELAVAEGGV